jgi:hypothetical protein
VKPSTISPIALACALISCEPPAAEEGKPSAAARASAQPQRSASAEPRTSASSAAPAGTYSVPADVCALADATLLPPEAGEAGEGSAIKEDTRYTLTGCSFDLQGEDAINAFKLFVVVDDLAPARFTESSNMWLGNTIPGYVGERVSGLGTAAVYAARRSAEKRRIETVLAVHHDNLYVEARFMGGGSKEWDAAGVKDGLVAVVRTAMRKVPRK